MLMLLVPPAALGDGGEWLDKAAKRIRTSPLGGDGGGGS